jgi:hypothetical protein
MIEWAVVIVVLIQLAVVGYLVGTMLRHIQTERRSSNIRKIWSNFGLSIALALLFFTSWVGQAVAEWQVFKIWSALRVLATESSLPNSGVGA